MPSSSPFPQVPEILRLICEHLSSDKCTLARLARTCKLLEEPALDTLWFDISGFYSLVKCLPDDALKVEKRTYRDERLTFTRLLKPVELTRYLRYSRRVQHFSNKGDPTTIDLPIYHILQLSFQNGKLLPNLRRLTWHFESDSIGLLYMFLGPRLTEISFQLKQKPQVPELSIITALDGLYPSLKYLSFDLEQPPGYVSQEKNDLARRQTIETLSDSIQIYKWINLQTLKIMNLTWSALDKISQLPQLRRLEIIEFNFHSTESQTTSCAGGGFSMLTDLLLGNCSNASDCIAVLKVMDLSPIKTMELEFRENVPTALWEEIILAISQHCKHQTLRALKCVEWLRRPASSFNHAPENITFEVIRPLLAFRDLESINIEAAKVISIPDAAAVEEIANSWKKIRCLNFKLQRGFFYGDLEKVPVKLLDLALFAEHCPELEELGICFDASSPPRIDHDNVFAVNKYRSRLSKLNVGVSPITNAALVAANLSGIFPSLKSVSATPTCSDALEYWAEVSGLVSVFSAVRKQTLGWPSV